MLGYSLAILVGFSLGLLGGGGSILTVPILVYIVGQDPKIAVPLSLAIVGATSLFGVYRNIKKHQVDFKIALVFGAISVLGTFLGTIISKKLTGEVQLVIFAVIMLFASFSMIKGRKESEQKAEHKTNFLLVLIQGFIVGIITGIVGVGGGFLIVPALVLLANLPMRKAVGTSLLLIAINSFFGFGSYILAGNIEIPWNFLITFTLLSIVGVIIGSMMADKVPQKTLKKIFGIFLIFMGLFILYKERSAFTKENVKPIKSQFENQAEKEKMALKAIKRLGKDLKQKLQSALKVSDLNALSVCNTKASLITQKAQSYGVKVGRISEKNRNPDNTPSNWMLPYMEQFRSGEVKEPYLTVKLDHKYGILKPIFTAPMCLKCHGENIDSTLKSKLDELYPNDKAIGFKTGDIRGYFYAEF